MFKELINIFITEEDKDLIRGTVISEAEALANKAPLNKALTIATGIAAIGVAAYGYTKLKDYNTVKDSHLNLRS